MSNLSEIRESTEWTMRDDVRIEGKLTLDTDFGAVAAAYIYMEARHPDLVPRIQGVQVNGIYNRVVDGAGNYSYVRASEETIIYLGPRNKGDDKYR